MTPPAALAIVDIGAGNLGSIRNIYRRLGIEASVASTPEAIAEAPRLLLPGVGAFSAVAQRLRNSGLLDALELRVRKDGVPFLGVCVGMQLLGSGSEEGPDEPGLGWIDGKVIRVYSDDPDIALRVPHVGWNTCEWNLDDPLFHGLPQPARFYFTHSYCMQAGAELSSGMTHYGIDFVSAVRHQNIWGVQFHPEKSSRIGMQLLANFAERCQ